MVAPCRGGIGVSADRNMASLAVKIPTHQTELDLPQATSASMIPVPIMRAAGYEIELASMTFGFRRPDQRAGRFSTSAPRVGNFANSNLPHSGVGSLRIHGHEVSEGKTSLHAQWHFVHGHRRFWREAVGNKPPTFTILTTDSGPDVAPYHNGEVVVLQPRTGPTDQFDEAGSQPCYGRFRQISRGRTPRKLVIQLLHIQNIAVHE